MHPNYTPKKVALPPEWATDDPYEVTHHILRQPLNSYDKSLLFGDTQFGITFAKGLLYENSLDREASWQTIMAPGRMKGHPSNIDGFNIAATRRKQKLAKRENSKTATDSLPHGTYFYRSWNKFPQHIGTTLATMVLEQR